MSCRVSAGQVIVLAGFLRRSASILIFSLFSAAQFVWGLALVLPSDPSGAALSWLLLSLAQLASLALLIWFCFSFPKDTRPPRPVLLALPPLLGLAMLLIVQNAFALTDGGVITAYAVTLSARLLSIGLIVVLLAAAGYLRSQQSEQGLYRPLLAYGIALLAMAIDVQQLSLVAAVTSISVLIWLGRILLSEQLVKPLASAQAELAEAHAILQDTQVSLRDASSRVDGLSQDLDFANTFRQEFMSTMSHELRTPLNSIIGYSELLSRTLYGELNARQYDRIERIYRNGLYLSKLINAILDLNKIEAGKFYLETDKVQPKELIEGSVSNYRYEAETKGLALECVIIEPLPEVTVDSLRLAQVIMNLLENAIKFSETGTVRVLAQPVHVSQGASTDVALPVQGWLRDGDWLLIEVSDEGIGIAPEFIHLIFDRFSQVDSSRTRVYDGIGLGLTIARKLVEMHDGLLWVRSQPGQGSNFFVALPAGSRIISTGSTGRLRAVKTGPLQSS